MSGPVSVSGPGHTLAAVCQGLHPLPVMFQAVLELEPGVRWVIIELDTNPRKVCRFTIERRPLQARAFFQLKVPTSAFRFKTLC